MKRNLVVVALVGALASLGAQAALADTSTDSAPAAAAQAPGAKHAEWAAKARQKRMAAMADILGLSDAQKTTISAIFADQRQASAPLRQKLADGREQMHQAMAAIPFNEAAVRAAAANREAARTELTVARARTQSMVMAVLNPDQQKLAKKLHFLMRGDRRKHAGPHQAA